MPEYNGRVIGGGSSINATIWARPFKADLDHWAAETGDHRWGLRARAPAFQEHRELARHARTPPSAVKAGPVWVQPAADPLPMATACLDAFRELGLPVLDDLNGEREITGNGFAYMNQIIEDGRRHSMARAFLYPVLARENVTVLVNTQVNRVHPGGNRAVGVECARDGQTQTFRADREVILSAGGFNTPKLLMLSGIGDEARAARVRHPRARALTQRRQERARPRAAWRLPVRSARAVRLYQQRCQRVGLLQDRSQLRTARRQHRGDRASLRQRHHRQGVPGTAQHVGPLRRPGHAAKPRHGSAPVCQPGRPADRGYALPEPSRRRRPNWSGASRSPAQRPLRLR